MKRVDIVGLGELVVDWVAEISHFPKPDEKVDALSENYFPGGVTGNFLTAVARLGIKCGFIGAVGDDSYGNYLIKELIKENIDATYTLKKKDKKTPINFIFIAEGEKSIIQSPHMQKTKLELNDIDESYISNSKLLHTTLIHPKISKHAINIAKKSNVKVSIDIESQIAKRGWEALKDMLLLADVLIPNKEGAKILTNSSDPFYAAKKLVEKGIPLVIITLGREGVLISSKTFQKCIPAYPIKNIIDTTGAGDAFNGAFSVAYWIFGWDVIRSCKYACGAAALKIQKLGARTGLPDQHKLAEFLRANDVLFKENGTFIKQN